MNVVIVGKTRMGGAACVGALTVDTGESLRLKLPHGEYPQHSPFDVGTIWDIVYEPAVQIEPPHVEDVIVQRQRFVGVQQDLDGFVLERIDPWRGGLGSLYDGLVRFTASGHGYISSRTGIPQVSTGFWIPDQALTRSASDDRYFRYGDGYPIREIKYVGLATTQPRWPANGLVRVSLARWWRPDDAPDFEDRCYLQLSGCISALR